MFGFDLNQDFCDYGKSRQCRPLPIPLSMENQSVDLRKKWKILFEPNLRITTQEHHLSKAPRTVLPLEVKSQLYRFFETEGWTSNDILLTV